MRTDPCCACAWVAHTLGLRCARVATKALLPLLARPNSHSDTGMKVLRLGPCRCPSGKPLSMRAPPPPPETVNSASHYPLHRPFRRREQPAVKPSPPSSLPADPHDRLAPVAWAMRIGVTLGAWKGVSGGYGTTLPRPPSHSATTRAMNGWPRCPACMSRCGH